MNKAESLAKACKDLMLLEPFYGLFLMTLNKTWSDKVPTAGVGLRGINVELIINPEFWESLTADQQIGLLKHELLHVAFFHLTDYDHLKNQRIANIAMDVEINQYILKKHLPPGPQLPECYPELDLSLKAGTLYYYDKLFEEINDPCESLDIVLKAMEAGETSCTLPDGTTVNLPQHSWDDVEQQDEATSKLIKTQMGHVLTQIAEQVTKSRGTIPGEIEHVLTMINTKEPPKFDWRGYVKRFAGKSVKIYTKKSRRKLNKRLPDFPGLKIKQHKHILVGVDVSGSVSNKELKEFFHEIYHMYKTGSEVTVIQCDTAIKSLEPFKPKEEYEIKGRGGTDFQPVIDYYNENQHKYSCLMYVTDGEAPAPENATGDILWVLSSNSDMNDKLPGNVIKLN